MLILKLNAAALGLSRRGRRLQGKHQLGITLVELVVTIVILSISLIGIVATLNLGVSQSANTLFELRATALAQAYLDEILSKKYDERSRNSGIPPCVNPALPGRGCSASLGADGGETNRTRFDDVDDYDTLDEGLNGADILRDAQGDPRSGYDNFRVQVEVRRIGTDLAVDEDFIQVAPATPSNNPVPDDEFDAKLITVTVSDGSDEGIDFSAYKSNF
jgi:MSHA pilin protein MshD